MIVYEFNRMKIACVRKDKGISNLRLENTFVNKTNFKRD